MHECMGLETYPKSQIMKINELKTLAKLSSEIILNLFPSVSHHDDKCKFPTVKCNTQFNFPMVHSTGLWNVESCGAGKLCGVGMLPLIYKVQHQQQQQLPVELLLGPLALDMPMNLFSNSTSKYK